MLWHSSALYFPWLIRPQNHKIMVAVTAHCNCKCIGCRYGRDFMPGHQMSRAMVDSLLEDAAHAGFRVIRFYGGEPLLHADLAHMIASCRRLRMKPYITTNAVILNEKIDELYDAGLREITIGFYGIGDDYDAYVQRPGMFARMDANLATAHEKYGNDLNLQLNWLFMRPTCSIKAFTQAVQFAEQYNMRIQIDLIHYSLPYFQEGPDRALQFRPEDELAIREVVEEMQRVKQEKPDLINQSIETLRSIPDWLLKGPRMRVPCTANEMIWVGADGTVQLCYVTFELGNLHKLRFRDILCSNERKQASRAAFLLNCPNCHCGANDRIMRNAWIRRKYF